MTFGRKLDTLVTIMATKLGQCLLLWPAKELGIMVGIILIATANG